jgi:hypothetical protein
VDEEKLRDLPEEYAALGDRRAVMLEVAEKLKQLHPAVTALGDAIERAGLPGRDWRGDAAELGLLARRLGDLTIDDFITQLAEFTADHGPEWLHGGRRDLDTFHEEVAALYGMVRRLRRVSRRLRENPQGPARNRRAARLARVFGDERVAESLGHVAALLGDCKALEPFMGPLAPEEWDAAADGWAASRTASRTRATPSSNPPKRLRDYAPPKRRTPWQRLAALLALLGRRIRTFVSDPRGRQAIAVGVVLVVGAGVAILVVRQPHTAFPVTPSGTAAAQATARAAAASASPTPLPPTPTRRPAPTPRLALDCTGQGSQGSSATLTVKNVGSTAISWQANPPSNLHVFPPQGRLDVGQSTTANVASNNRKPVSGTIAVTASNGTRSASYSVACQ